MTVNSEFSSGQGGRPAVGKRVCPVVLAGGLSSRMGKDKALLKLSNGHTLLGQAKEVLETFTLPQGVGRLATLVSGARPGGVADRYPQAGPLGGLQAVAAHLREWEIHCDALLVIPVDMPQLSPALLNQLCAAGQAVEQAVCFGDFYLPCWLPLDDRCRQYLDAAAQGNAIASIRALFGYVGCMQLPVPAGDWHLNVNRPEDFQRLAR
ncbi:molybdenum cofactor guanylyltransferase [Microbulbifer mangrovi]|uniref:molybdenum cofactor guanylyltransferase n=1 Tax=Microbulbifer mangrovi TaxID=927787 RepID=UPI0009907092|nr:molybdenum cofactor guanylyltransferase [Microbulbifer mangrovi]